MPRIFLSYRREDSKSITYRIADRLRAKFGASNVFIDKHSIMGGDNFQDAIVTELIASDVVVVIMGKKWASDDYGKGRLADPEDWVRKEVEMALNASDQLVIPLLVNDAKMPSKANLPASLYPLLSQNAMSIPEDEAYFDSAINKLIKRTQSFKEDSSIRWQEHKWKIIGTLITAVLIPFIIAWLSFSCDTNACSQFPFLCGQCDPTPTPTLPVPTEEPTITPTSELTLTVPSTEEPTASATSIFTPIPITVTPTATLSQCALEDADSLLQAIFDRLCSDDSTLTWSENTTLQEIAEAHALRVSNLSRSALTAQAGDSEEAPPYTFAGDIDLVMRLRNADYEGTAEMLVVTASAGTEITVDAFFDEADARSVTLADYSVFGFGTAESMNGRQNAVLIIGR